MNKNAHKIAAPYQDKKSNYNGTENNSVEGTATDAYEM